MMTGIVVTGASGKCGSAAMESFPDAQGYDLSPTGEIRRLDILDATSFQNVLQGNSVLIHFAGEPSTEASWKSCMRLNGDGTRIAMECAVRAGVSKVILASSNHAMGLYEREEASRGYQGLRKPLLTERDTPRPDSFYGISKILLEETGRFYSEQYGIQVLCLRIGALLPAAYDHPWGYAELERKASHISTSSSQYLNLVNRLKAIWLSRRDFANLLQLASQSQIPGFRIYNAVSANTHRWFDTSLAERELGWHPQDNGALWVSPPEFQETK